MQIDQRRYELKLAETDAEREGARRLRYRVFVEELGARASAAEHAARQEWDDFDAHVDQLILIYDAPEITDPLDRIVGVYRVMTSDVAAAGAGFYSAAEYDLSPITASGRRALELGRSCVAAAHRNGVALHMLWTGLAEYVLDRDIEILFGVASFHGTDPAPYAAALSYLHAHYLAPPPMRVRALPPHALPMDILPPERIEARAALDAMPSLVRAYLRLGGHVGDGAYIDHDFNTIDVCVVMDTQRMNTRYRARFEEKWREGVR